ncbi:hypothetical protein EON63_02895 [archaeon]|nr:MAG: hypothetical protein EON63_02895 [archaeon]
MPCDIGDLPLPAGVTEIIKATNQANHTQQHVHQGHGGNKGIAGVKREMEEETGQSHSKKLKTSL